MSARIKTIHSGSFYISNNPNEWIVTSLGSSVAVCIYDRVLKLGGVCHFVLPNRRMSQVKLGKQPEKQLGKQLGKQPEKHNDTWQFGDEAIPLLLKQFKEKGSKKQNLEISIVGACALNDSQPIQGKPVEELNSACAKTIFRKMGVSISREKTGNCPSGMQLKFNLGSGQLYFKENTVFKKDNAPSVLSAEPQQEIRASFFRQTRVKVLIVDDAPVVRKVLKAELGKYADLEIVGEAASADEAESLRKKLSPDVMTLDINMPGKDGIQYLGELMKRAPMAVIMVSSLNKDEASPVMTALELGAFEYVQKPSLSEIHEVGSRLHELIIESNKYYKRRTSPNLQKSELLASKVDPKLKLIAIGASTGGTEALKVVIAKCPVQSPPIVIVQHMPPYFTAEFAKSLGKISKLKVKEAENDDLLVFGSAYVAPGGRQMKVIQDRGGYYKIRLTDDPPVNRFRPSVDYLFFSLVELGLKSSLHAAILTGMGDDGARGLLALRKDGAYTVGQSQETCAVYGMPKAAYDMGSVVKELPLELIANDLISVKVDKKKIA